MYSYFIIITIVSIIIIIIIIIMPHLVFSMAEVDSIDQRGEQQHQCTIFFLEMTIVMIGCWTELIQE